MSVIPLGSQPFISIDTETNELIIESTEGLHPNNPDPVRFVPEMNVRVTIPLGSASFTNRVTGAKADPEATYRAQANRPAPNIPAPVAPDDDQETKVSAPEPPKPPAVPEQRTSAED